MSLICCIGLYLFARGLHTRTAVARLPLRQLAFLVYFVNCAFQAVRRPNEYDGVEANS